MHKFDRIWCYNSKYVKELDVALQKCMPSIIKAFTNIYGEKYADYIYNQISNINIIYFLPRLYFADILCTNKGIRKRHRYIADYYLSYLCDLEHKASSYQDKDEFIVDNYFFKSYKNSDNLEPSAVELIIDESIPCFVIDTDLKKTTYLPIFCLSLELIIHEINHALSQDAIAITDDALLEFNLFSDELVLELINDYIAIETYHEYLKLGSKVPKCLNRFKVKSEYSLDFYLIEYFYLSLKPLILHALITKNERIFTLLVGACNIERFYFLIHELKSNYSDVKYQELKEVVDQMRENVLAHTELEDYDFYKEMKNNEYTRILK